MAGPKAQEALRMQKEARQKKMLIALAPVLLGLLAWQGPGTLKAITGGNAPPETPPAAAPATDDGPVDPTTAAPPTTAGGAAATPVAAVVELPDSDSPDSAGPGQLVTFDRFVGKDPFQQQVKDTPAEAAPPPPPPPPGPAKVDDGATKPPASGSPGTSAPAPTSAVLAINGTKEAVAVDGTFPQGDPIFRLAAVTRSSIKIGLVSGEFTSGSGTVTVKRGKSVTLVSQPDGLRYVIKYVAAG